MLIAYSGAYSILLESGLSEEINQDNPMGTSGKLAEAYAAFAQHMWSAKK